DRLAYHHLGGLHRATGGRGQSRSSAPVEDQAGTESDTFGVGPPQGTRLGGGVVGVVMVGPDEICFEQTETEPLSYGQVHSATEDSPNAVMGIQPADCQPVVTAESVQEVVCIIGSKHKTRTD